MVSFIGGSIASQVSPGVMSGWQDYSDLTTQTTAIALSGTPVAITNDGAGPFTNTTYRVNGHGDIWNTSTNVFDFTSLKLGDTVDFRVDLTVTTTSPNTVITTDIEMAVGGTPYILTFDSRAYKNSGTYEFTRWSSVYMGDSNTLSNGARFLMASDGAGDSVTVNGWYVRTNVR